MNTVVDFNYVNKRVYDDDIIVVSGLKKKYKKNIVLDIDYLKIEKEKVYLIVGENGSGKSTLIKCLCGIIEYKGRVLNKANRISYLPERMIDFPYIRVGKLIELMTIDYKNSDNIRLINELCNFLELDVSKRVNELSKGNLQKMMIIITLINKSDLYIFDEPLNGLDDKIQEKFLYLLKTLRNNNKTIIITTHYKHYYQGLYDYVIELDKGNVK